MYTSPWLGHRPLSHQETMSNQSFWSNIHAKSRCSVDTDSSQCAICVVQTSVGLLSSMSRRVSRVTSSSKQMRFSQQMPGSSRLLLRHFLGDDHCKRCHVSTSIRSHVATVDSFHNQSCAHAPTLTDSSKGTLGRSCVSEHHADGTHSKGGPFHWQSR